MYLPDVPDIYIGDYAVERVYLGQELVWPTNYESLYTTLEILSAGTLSFQSESCIDGVVSHSVVLDYSINESGWTHITWTTTINVQAGDSVRIKALFSDRPTGSYVGDYAPSLSGSTAVFNVYGNALSLIYGDAFTANTSFSQSYAFSALFKDTNVVSARHWILPKQQTYYAKWFNQTFQNAHMLIEGPVFRCSSASTSCFDWCYMYATSLEKIAVPYLEQIPTQGFNAWVTGVPSTGTFAKKTGVSWDYRDSELVWHNYGSYGIPAIWDIVEA